ncbi:sporulation protein YqfD [Fictibacillus sp. WQ 8-8]|uniref:sporulation protein YqfD n=1 Tax=unclassified Fictibacillus TaxID=2644029 RepID=UPI0006A7ABA4|nr:MULTISPECIES: sporulation protein YqfD [unclassified Fictibacillus]MCQ6266270.1 sporulation protein YqfD [Fictibacillus sp. WQ 8-8]MED2972510.1 sporulation protein YqfD [Fictibacillus sp. B-59209]UZJ80603.1 sporulation protein YqfD [Fictibacillus sp. KU28468]
MKKDWLEPINSYVKVEIRGENIEDFINECLAQNISIWNIRRTNENAVTAYLYTKNIKGFRPLLKQTGCKIRFIEKNGLPFWAARMWRRNGLILGLAGFLVILFLLSNMVWNINVTGANPKTEYQLLKAAKELGIKKGKFIFLLPNVRQLQQQLTNAMDNVTWIGVSLNGTTYNFQVVEKEIPKRKEALSPRHLVAKKDAVIYDMFVEKGQPVVAPHQFVYKGALLVSGYIGKEGKTKLVPAKGVVLGETWYTTNVTIPLATKFQTYTGNTVTQHKLRLFGLRIPIWGWKDGEYKTKDVSENETPLKFWKWTLPVSYIKKVIRETDGVKRVYTKEEAVQAGRAMAKKEVRKLLAHDAQIKEEKILRQSVSNGKVNLSMHYQVIENIASEQPILIQQGD